MIPPQANMRRNAITNALMNVAQPPPRRPPMPQGLMANPQMAQMPAPPQGMPSMPQGMPPMPQGMPPGPQGMPAAPPMPMAGAAQGAPNFQSPMTMPNAAAQGAMPQQPMAQTGQGGL